MKILCISDEINNTLYSPHVKTLFHDIDIILSCGDLPYSYLDYLHSILNKPLFFIDGNHYALEYTKNNICHENIFEASTLKHAGNINDTITTCTSLLIMGLPGSKHYNNGPYQYSDSMMCLKIIRLIPRLLYNRIRYGRFVDILLTHASPYGVHDTSDRCHTGFTIFLWFMRIFKPHYLLHGHIHLYNNNTNRLTLYQHTHIINVFNYYILEI